MPFKSEQVYKEYAFYRLTRNRPPERPYLPARMGGGHSQGYKGEVTKLLSRRKSYESTKRLGGKGIYLHMELSLSILKS